MASSLEFVTYVCEQLKGLGAVRAKKMFGEYLIYLNDRPVVMVCDDTVYMKMLPGLASLLGERPAAPPYEGAKDHYVLDPDDRDILRQAVALAEGAVPLPKRRSRRKRSYLPQAHEKIEKDGEGETAAGRYPCPCCGYITFPSPKETALAYICPVCLWENDVFAPGEDDPSDENRGMTLRAGRENYLTLGAAFPEGKGMARAPRPEEFPAEGAGRTAETTERN